MTADGDFAPAPSGGRGDPATGGAPVARSLQAATARVRTAVRSGKEFAGEAVGVLRGGLFDSVRGGLARCGRPLSGLPGPVPALAGPSWPGGACRTPGTGDGSPRPPQALREAQRARGAKPAAGERPPRGGKSGPAPASARPPRAPRRSKDGTGSGKSGTGGGGVNSFRRLRARLERAWDRPLTAYYLILGGSLLLTALGLVMVFSASQIQALQSGLDSTYFFGKQLVAAVIGAGLLFLASRIPIKLHRAFAYPLLIVSMFLMCLVQVPGIGRAVNGNQNWIYLGGPFQLQPSEFAKLALVLWGADLLARKHDKQLLTQWKHLLVPFVPVTLLLLGLIMLGGDMGTAIILTAVLFGLLWLAGAPTRLFVGVLVAALAVGALLIKTSPNRMGRLACIGATDPGANDQCWQAVHGIYALASGGWFGSGLGASVEKWGQLPEPHTDFIFAVTGEELGLAGTLSVLALFAALGYAGIRVAGRTEDPFVRFAAGGVTTWITAQAVVNIGAVLGLLPIAGVPLPLFSYGGSALLPTMFAIGLLIAFARSDPAASAALAMRQPALRQLAPWRGPAGVRWKTMRRRASRPPSGER